MQKLKFQKHLQHQIIPRKGIKTCKTCARLYIKYSWLDYSATGMCYWKKNSCHLFQKHDTHKHTSWPEWQDSIVTVCGTDWHQGFKRLNQLRLHFLSCTWIQSSPSSNSFHTVWTTIDPFCGTDWHQGLRRLNQLTVIRSPIEASLFILHMDTIITIIK
jgi:hypothetical protein